MFYRLGSYVNKSDSMSAADFSRVFGMASGRGKWANAIVELTSSPESDPYAGLYIRWHYPGCPYVRKT